MESGRVNCCFLVLLVILVVVALLLYQVYAKTKDVIVNYLDGKQSHIDEVGEDAASVGDARELPHLEGQRKEG